MKSIFVSVILSALCAVSHSQNITKVALQSENFASTSESNKDLVKFSPYFAKIGRTVFVSGSSDFWIGPLLRALPAVGDEAAMRIYKSDQLKQVDLIVFVNATSPLPEKVTGAWFLIARMQGHGVSTKIVGECDMFCARLFIAGKTREFGQDIKGTPTRLKIQVPVDFETKLIERKFPDTQISFYEKFLPEFTKKHRDLLIRGFTQPTDTTGGIFIGPEDVKYCSSLKVVMCEDYAGLTAFGLGLTTSNERSSVVLPARFPAPLPTDYAKIDEVSKLPLRSEEAISWYLKFLKSPNSKNRAFAISEDVAKDIFLSSWGTIDGEDAAGRALTGC